MHVVIPPCAPAALWDMLPAVKLSLKSARGFPAAANFPRAHYPFPERGRCALGVGVPLHPSVSHAAHSSGGGGAWALEDCWSLGGEVPPRARPACAPPIDSHWQPFKLLAAMHCSICICMRWCSAMHLPELLYLFDPCTLPVCL